MRNSEVAKILENIADLLEIKGESSFKVRAYRKAARSVGGLPQDLQQLMNEGKLKTINGVGDAIAKKLTELLTTGRLEFYEKLLAKFPEGVNTLLEVPGVGPKTAVRLAEELGIRSPQELVLAIEEGRVSELHGLGPKTVERMLLQVRCMCNKEQHNSFATALMFAEGIATKLRMCPSLSHLFFSGNLRRCVETVDSIDLIAVAKLADEVIGALVNLPQVRGIVFKGDTKASVIADQDIQVNLDVVDHRLLGSYLLFCTGSEKHLIALMETGYRKGYKVEESGVSVLETGELECFSTEEGVYQRLGMQFVPPEIREGGIEIGKAERHILPKLVDLTDIRGDLHVHTQWSDGACSIEEICMAARDIGYEYLAITDHSVGRGIAHGLDQEGLRNQISEITRLNEKWQDFRVFSGVEVDIRADGSLDLPNDILAELDIVVAAVHSGLGQDEQKMTSRIIRALENPVVDILAHPSCRLLSSRMPIALNWDSIFNTAIRTGTMMEINSMPDRLDLCDHLVYKARELGVKVAINTDAHALDHLRYMRFGVGVARRGWCEGDAVLNSRTAENVYMLLRDRRRKSS
ncbi:MAG: DNA polymerase/3'-5' exonuclease PolX [Chloroflexota bacterium]|nr:DNA polymerase/3'-5' exonuclease PolX [Chloroflexota bacterium]